MFNNIIAGVYAGGIFDFDFHMSSGSIYWADFTNTPMLYGVVTKLNVHRIKPDGSDYADLVSVSAVKQIRNISALAIDWISGMVRQHSVVFKNYKPLIFCLLVVVVVFVLLLLLIIIITILIFSTLISKDPEG